MCIENLIIAIPHSFLARNLYLNFLQRRKNCKHLSRSENRKSRWISTFKGCGPCTLHICQSFTLRQFSLIHFRVEKCNCLNSVPSVLQFSCSRSDSFQVDHQSQKSLLRWKKKQSRRQSFRNHMDLAQIKIFWGWMYLNFAGCCSVIKGTCSLKGCVWILGVAVWSAPSFCKQKVHKYLC